MLVQYNSYISRKHFQKVIKTTNFNKVDHQKSNELGFITVMSPILKCFYSTYSIRFVGQNHESKIPLSKEKRSIKHSFFLKYHETFSICNYVFWAY